MAGGKQNNHRDNLVRISEVSEMALLSLEMAKLQLPKEVVELPPALESLAKQLSRIVTLSQVEE